MDTFNNGVYHELYDQTALQLFRYDGVDVCVLFVCKSSICTSIGIFTSYFYTSLTTGVFLVQTYKKSASSKNTTLTFVQKPV